jgi:hypothetical protein
MEFVLENLKGAFPCQAENTHEDTGTRYICEDFKARFGSQ